MVCVVSKMYPNSSGGRALIGVTSFEWDSEDFKSDVLLRCI